MAAIARPRAISRAYQEVIASTARDRSYWEPNSYPASLPHIAVPGRRYWSSNPRLLIVGKAGAVSENFTGHPQLMDILQSRRKPKPHLLEQRAFAYWKRMLNSEVPTYYSDSQATNLNDPQPWWQEIYRLVAPLRGIQLAPTDAMSRGAMEGGIFQTIAWANLLKVDLGKGAAVPPKKTLDWHATSGGLTLLRDEVEWLQPDIVVFATGPSFDPILNRAGFGVGAQVRGHPLRTEYNIHRVKMAPLNTGKKPLAVRCYHFEVRQPGLSRRTMYTALSSWLATNSA